ncbi:esterase/lipase family protein [Streptomyces tanashiensis]|uniref:esterase/lipase family protein n=2 Tax=Streptomyces tanashiensis TaxID=67367 RepID=UPI0036E7AABE
MEHDLVVFVPGFLGTRLTLDGHDLWGEYSEALLGRGPQAPAPAGLVLPPGLGDGLPDARFRPAADELLMVPDAMPGLLCCMGYPDIRAALGDPVEGQFVPFPYDWRLSHRLIADLLKVRVERELARWSEQVDSHYPDRPDDPQVVLVCHSTGGLVGRHYLECSGGRETARTLVTLGTPQQGLAQAVRLLTGKAVGADEAPGADARPLNEALRDLALGWPSVAQLLPVYDAVRVEGRSRLRTLVDRRYPVPDLPTALVEDAVSFHSAFQQAREAHRHTDTGGRLPYEVLCVGSTAFPTERTVGLTPDGTRLLARRDESLLAPGDGTVPGESAVAEWALRDTTAMHWTEHRHADLAGAAAVGEMLTAVRKGEPAGGMLAGDEQISVYAPESAAAGKPFAASVVGTGLRERNVQAHIWRIGRPTKEPVVFTATGSELYRAELQAGPGKWVVEATADGPHRSDRKVIILYSN